MKLQIKRGLPGSGKTTEARATVLADGNVGRINRDDLRAMLFDSKWTGRREQVVIACEKAIAEVLAYHQHSAIIDDTNLTQNHVDLWKGVAKNTGFTEVVTDPLVVDIPIAVERDAGREKPVGKAVIHRMALNAGLIDFGEKPIVIVDLDGTVADGTHREGWLADEKKDWQAYFALCVADSPVDIVVRWVRELAKTHTICIVSGRPDSTQFDTIWWLAFHEVPYDWLFMRSSSDRRPDTQIRETS